MVFPSVTSALGMLETGVSSLAGWLFGQLATVGERLSFLAVRYPNATMPELTAGLDLAQSSWQAAQQAQAGFGLPTASQIPLDPSIPTPDTIRTDLIVQIPNASDPRRPTTRLVTVDTPAGQTPLQYQQALEDNVRQNLAQDDWTRPTGGVGPATQALNNFTYSYKLVSVTRS